MKITSIAIYAIRLPLKQPFVISYHTYKDMPSIIVKVETDEGLIGYGEAVPDEHVTGETWEGTYQVIKHTLGPAILGINPMEIEKVHEIMDKLIYQAPAAKAAIDIACYDLIGKKLQVPVYQLIGGRYHEQFPITHVLSIGEPEKMATEALEQVSKGYTSFKIKVGRDVNGDVARIKAVADSVKDKAVIRVDVNQGWQTAAATLKGIKALETVDIDWLEQPVSADDIDGMAFIRSHSTVSLMIDEGLKGARELKEIIQKNACDRINIKLMKCGGILPAVKLAYQAELAGIECQVGSMVESSIASSAGFHVSFSKKNITSVELTGPLKFSKDIGDLHYDIPHISLKDQPGLGVNIDEEILKELTVFEDVLKES